MGATVPRLRYVYCSLTLGCIPFLDALPNQMLLSPLCSLVDLNSLQPSPIRLPPKATAPGRSSSSPSSAPPGIEPTLTNLNLSSSFNLFNESFDMNLEGLLGPSSSFGYYLGPMKSLSFGLGLNGSLDYGDGSSNNSMRMSPNSGGSGGDGGGGITRRQQYLKMSLTNDGMETNDDDDAASVNGSSGGGVEDVHPRSESGTQPPPNSVHEGMMSATASIITTSNVDSSTSQACTTPIQVLNGSSAAISYGNDVFRKAPPSRAEYNDTSKPPPPRSGRTTSPSRKQQHRMDPSLFGAMEQHQSIFSTFSFLLPGAKTIIENRPREKDAVASVTMGNSNSSVNCCSPTEIEKEVARRRVNSALCAFGGVAFPSSKDCDSMDRSKRLRWVQNYKDSIPERYYEDESRLSWEIEENPPIEISESEEDEDDFINEHDEDAGERRRASVVDHHAADKSSLHRNIGIMVYPAVNAFTATEPGIITPALSDVNNFVDREPPPTESTPSKVQEELTVGIDSYAPMVTPDSIQRSVNYAGGVWISNHQSPRKVSPGGKSPDGQSNDLLFLDTQELQPEQYRAVGQKRTNKRKSSSSNRIRYLYPALPLPYGQRKRISNAMFAMSKSIPGLTDECASVLGDARREDAWDFAVAQLMTQVIVVTHCSVEDRRLDGLSKYLLTLG